MTQLPEKNYEMKISRLVVDKLGVKLYDKVSAVIAEIVANSYDADAKLVTVSAPMAEFLAKKSDGKTDDLGYSITVEDNGHGMSPEEVKRHYLIIGSDRRLDSKRGDISRTLNRKVMGRKGVGKLAPFGICSEMEILCSGGKPIQQNGKDIYRVAHLYLERDEILNITIDSPDKEKPYYPKIGDKDGTLSEKSGMKITLRNFEKRKVPEIDQFERQVAQRFGIRSKNWEIELIDNLKPSQDPDRKRTVGDFTIDRLTETTLYLEKISGENKVLDSNRDELDIPAGFNVEGKFYPLTGWIARSKQNYKDDLMAGVRIYCRGKIAAQTAIFNLNSGFTGEYDIRSYLVGELNANWLDEEDDLIQTDRQDILWSSEIGEAFEEYGQRLVKLLGKLSEKPRKEVAWKQFKEDTDIENEVRKTYPRDDQEEIRKNSIELAQIFAKSARDAELTDSEHQSQVLQLSLLFGPHLTLDQKLREAADAKEHTIAAITALMKTARVAELSSFGRVAEKRVNVVHELEKLKDSCDAVEGDLQNLIAGAPWLIDPRWSPISQNQSFRTFKTEFAKFYKEKTGKELVYAPTSNSTKRPDFALASEDTRLEVVEIKKPKHILDQSDAERFIRYFEYLDDFFESPLNKDITKVFPDGYRITVVCDGRKDLSFQSRKTIENYEKQSKINFISWAVFLKNASMAHQDFLEAFKRNQNLALTTDEEIDN